MQSDEVIWFPTSPFFLELSWHRTWHTQANSPIDNVKDINKLIIVTLIFFWTTLVNKRGTAHPLFLKHQEDHFYFMILAGKSVLHRVLSALLVWFCLMDVASDTRAKGRYPHPWLLLPWQRRRRRHYSKRLVWARRYSFSSSPRPSAELPGSGEDNSGALWIQFASKIYHAITVILPHGLSLVHISGGGKQIYPSLFPRGHWQAVPSSIPAPSQYQSGGIDSP